jgi:hypothetical protein
MDNSATPGREYVGPQRTSNINVNEFASKFRGKREIFNFLTLDVKAYLPAYETITVVSSPDTQSQLF